MLTEVVQILGVLLVGTLVVLRFRTKRRDRRAAGGNVPKKRSTGWPASSGSASVADGGSSDGGSSDAGGGSSCGGGGGCGGGG